MDKREIEKAKEQYEAIIGKKGAGREEKLVMASLSLKNEGNSRAANIVGGFLSQLIEDENR